MKKLFYRIGCTLYIMLIICLLWFAISYIDIIVHNLSNSDYSRWNLFILVFGGL